MSFKELDLKSAYDSDRDELLEDFYIPVLKKAKRYDRITAFFSSDVYQLAWEGLSELLENEGSLNLIFNVLVKEEDKKELEASSEDAERYLRELLEENFLDLNDEVVRNSAKLLGWLIARKKLEIKLITTEAPGLFHQKVGILHDNYGNKLSFSGSVNETATGVKGNIEEFKVFREWNQHERKFFKEDLHKFQKYWGGYSKKARTYSLPEAIRNRLLKISPQNQEELRDAQDFLKKSREKLSGISPLVSEKPEIEYPSPRDYQKEAIENWIDNDYKGMWKMATGSGKTLAALWALEKLLKDKGKTLSVIVAPTNVIIEQWLEEIDKIEHDLNVTTTLPEKSKWVKEIERNILDLTREINENLVIITTYQTYYKDEKNQKNLLDLVEDVEVPKLLICDEVHRAGAKEWRKGLREFYDFRLGVSATPKRYYDLDGANDLLSNYFEGVLEPEYGLYEAIKDGWLCEYEYHTKFVDLTPEEMDKYRTLTEKLGKAYHAASTEEEQKEVLNRLGIKRAKIIKNADEKLDRFKEMVNEISPLKRTLVYCAPGQFSKVKKILRRMGINFHQVTKDEDYQDRSEIKERFSSGDLDVLVSMRVLDEGFNVPSIETAIIVSSTGNPRQYIQRRGRILRKHEGKDYAKIHDVLVVPGHSQEGYTPSEIEKRIVQKELKRYLRFMEESRNPVKNIDQINRLMKTYGVPSDL